MDDVATVAVEDGAEEVEGAGDVEIADIDVPVFVRLQGLHEAGSFFGRGGRRAVQQSDGFESAVNGGRAASDHIGIEHHESKQAIAFERMRACIVADVEFFIVDEPVVAWDPGIVFVDFSEAKFPVVEFAGADADPGEEATSRDFGLVAPVADVVDDGVTGVVRHPLAL